MSQKQALKKELLRLAALPGEDLDPAEGALLIAAFDHPERSLEPYQDILAEIRENAALGQVVGSVEERQDLLNRVLIGRFGFEGPGEENDEGEGIDFIRVLDTRKGMPITLGILYLHVARANGWSAHALAFPHHFLLRLQDDCGRRLIMDPFCGGRRVEPADMRAMLKGVQGEGAELRPQASEALDNRQVLLRLFGCIHLCKMRDGDKSGLLKSIETALLFAPDAPSLWREGGMVQLQLGNVPEAVVMLERYAVLTNDPNEKRKVSAILAELYKKPFSRH